MPDEFRPDFEKRADAFGVSMEGHFAQIKNIQESGRYTPGGAQQEIRTLSLARLKEINDARTPTREKLTAQISTLKVAKPAKTEDPGLRYQKQRDLTRFMNEQDPLQHKSILADADEDTLDLLETAPRYLGSKVDRKLVAEARERIAEMNPEVAKLAALSRAYEFLYNTAEQAVREAAHSVGLIDLVPDAPKPADVRKPYVLSTGEPATEKVAR